MIIESKAVGPFFKNGFVVSCERTREAVLIDPGDEVPSLLDYITSRQLSVQHILLTHAHVDHLTGVPAAKRSLNAPVHLHQDDLFLYDRAAEQADAFGLHVDQLPRVDRFYDTGQVIRFGRYEVRPLHTPGHCPGGVCLAIRGEDDTMPNLFVGDTLFAGSIGRTDLEGGDYDTLLTSIRDVLFSFGDETPVHPGHGPSTTVGRERATNPFLA